MNDSLPETVRLGRIALKVRQLTLTMVASAKKGHIGGSLSCADILVALYFGGVLDVRPAEPQWEARDRFVFSKGHSCEALYATLSLAGFFPEDWLETYGKNGTKLGGHPDRSIPGIEVSAGSLGHGLGQAAGLAFAARHLRQPCLSLALLGDGECYEGSIWESAQFAAHHELGGLIAIVDRNREITLDDTEDCNRMEPFAEKWRSFGWEARECNGHDFEALLGSLADARSRNRRGMPLVVIARTVKGKGVSFMEEQIGWHHSVPTGELLERARRDLGLAEE